MELVHKMKEVNLIELTDVLFGMRAVADGGLVHQGHICQLFGFVHLKNTI